jgi:hypothetical protein
MYSFAACSMADNCNTVLHYHLAIDLSLDFGISQITTVKKVLEVFHSIKFCFIGNSSKVKFGG